MSKIFNLALTSAKMLQTMDSTALKTDTQIIYRIPRVFKEQQDKLQVYFEEEYILIIENRTPKIASVSETGKICPVSESPLDSFRGRGLNPNKNLL